ncbi:sugar transferase [Singulisphaera rosea]
MSLQEPILSYEPLGPDVIHSREGRGARPSPLSKTRQINHYGKLKRAFDLVAASVGLAVVAPFLVLIALAIRLDSPGPLFFRQVRVGRGGRAFRIWKFRTMHVNAEAMLGDLESRNESPGGILFKLKHDPRVTNVGGLLRRTSLDEIPQFFNVLAGEMSLVGPRPLPERDCRLLQEFDPEGYARRLEAVPGITCFWQVGGRSRLGAQDMLRLDCQYIKERSLWLDVRLIARTVLVMADHGGAC